ncbi:MAG: ABC-2 family transporter protein [Actinomycetota bacterium]|nr:ABC-2 family transporter protein [Actinomycetota bacterium]
MLSCAVRLMRAGFLRYATYRQAVVAGLVTNTVFGFLRTAIVLTVFAGSARVAGYDPASAITFVWVGQGLLAVVMIFGDGELAARVRTGQISADLLRPVDVQAALLAEDLGRAGFAMLTRFAVPVVIGGLAFKLALPTSPGRCLVFAAGVVLAVVVSFGLRFLLNLTAFWLLDSRGVLSIYAVVAPTLAGLLIPVPYFPRWAASVLSATPFPAMVQTPTDLLLGRGDASWLLAGQLLWAVLLLGAGRLVLARAVRRLVVQGG